MEDGSLGRIIRDHVDDDPCLYGQETPDHFGFTNSLSFHRERMEFPTMLEDMNHIIEGEEEVHDLTREVCHVPLLQEDSDDDTSLSDYIPDHPVQIQSAKELAHPSLQQQAHKNEQIVQLYRWDHDLIIDRASKMGDQELRRCMHLVLKNLADCTRRSAASRNAIMKQQQLLQNHYPEMECDLFVSEGDDFS